VFVSRKGYQVSGAAFRTADYAFGSERKAARVLADDQDVGLARAQQGYENTLIVRLEDLLRDRVGLLNRFLSLRQAQIPHGYRLHQGKRHGPVLANGNRKAQGRKLGALRGEVKRGGLAAVAQ